MDLAGLKLVCRLVGFLNVQYLYKETTPSLGNLSMEPSSYYNALFSLELTPSLKNKQQHVLQK